MGATLIEPSEVIEVSSLSMLIYGPPGAWKTSIAQTADDPLTLDFDRGAHRAANRKAVMRFDRFADVAETQSEIAKRKTVVIDTVGRLLDMLAADIIEANPKHGSRIGGLSLQGFGVLKARFAAWVSQLRLAGKDLVFIAHEKEEKDGEDRYMRPDIQGGSYVEVMKFTDLVGYLTVDRQGRRVLDFSPTDKHLGKNSAGWEPITVPQLKQSPRFLADLLEDAKKRIGQVSEESAKAVALTDDLQEWLATGPTLERLNESIGEYSKRDMPKAAKAQLFVMMCDYAAKEGWEWNKKSKAFVAKETAVA